MGYDPGNGREILAVGHHKQAFAAASCRPQVTDGAFFGGVGGGGEVGA